jgi:hypothetical protein
MRSGVVVVAVCGLLAGCNWWRAERPPKPPPPPFPPVTDVGPDGPLIWAEARPNWGAPPLTVQFNVQPVETMRASAWAWDFGDGSPLARRRNPQHTYPQPGVYEARVWVRDVDGRIGLDTVTVRVGESE